MIYIAYSDIYYLPLPKGHRFPMEKYRQIPHRLLRTDKFSSSNFFEPTFEDITYIEDVHEISYINELIEGSLGYYKSRRIGFPYSKQMVNREIAICNGTVFSAERALCEGVSFNVAGGTHHAHKSHGEGYCIFNDIAVSAKYMLKKHKLNSILVVDLDVHQGNGTAKIFEGNPFVYTFSIHGSKIYPLKKAKSDLDIPVKEGIGDSGYLSLLKEWLPKVIERQKPELIYYLAGVDILATDILGKMNISINGCYERDLFVFQEAYKSNIPVVVSAGGGYSLLLDDIVTAHCNTYFAAKEVFG